MACIAFGFKLISSFRIDCTIKRKEKHDTNKLIINLEEVLKRLLNWVSILNCLFNLLEYQHHRAPHSEAEQG